MPSGKCYVGDMQNGFCFQSTPVLLNWRQVSTDSGRVLESIKAGKRLPEAGFVSMKVAPKAQSSVHKVYARDNGDSNAAGP